MEGIPQGVDLATAYFGDTGSGTVAWSFGSDVQMRYLVDGNTIELVMPGRTETFTSDEIVLPATPYTAWFQRNDENGLLERVLTLDRPIVDSVPLTYARYGRYLAYDTDIRFINFVFGVPTERSDVPVVGSASYTTTLGGVVSAPDPGGSTRSYYDLHSEGATFEADFASMSVTSTLHLVGTATIGTATGDRDFGTVTALGDIRSGGPGFGGNFLGEEVNGVFTGAFFGPGAAEIGYVFNVETADFLATGSVFGKQTPPP